MSIDKMGESINILNELKELDSAIIISLKKDNLYSYPEGYFIDLPQDIVRTIWLQSFSNTMLYSVPKSYFENLPELMLDKLTLSLNNTASNEELYSVPQNYFDGLANNVLQKIRSKNNSVEQELAELSPFLSKIPRHNVYSVPNGYFEKRVIIPSSASKQPAKVISLTGNKRKWYTYSAAACAAVIMFFGGYFYFHKNNSLENQLAKINVENAIAQLPDSSIDNYLQSDNAAFVNSSVNDQDLNVQTLIQNTSDEDIENYLRQNPDPDGNSGDKL